GDARAGQAAAPPGHAGQTMPHGAAAPPLGEGDGQPALAEEPPHHLLERDRAFSVDVGTEPFPEAGGDRFQPRLGLLGPSVNDEAERYLGKARPEREPPPGGSGHPRGPPAAAPPRGAPRLADPAQE